MYFFIRKLVKSSLMPKVAWRASGILFFAGLFDYRQKRTHDKKYLIHQLSKFNDKEKVTNISLLDSIKPVINKMKQDLVPPKGWYSIVTCFKLSSCLSQNMNFTRRILAELPIWADEQVINTYHKPFFRNEPCGFESLPIFKADNKPQINSKRCRKLHETVLH